MLARLGTLEPAVADIDTEQPSLEQVFLALTGGGEPADEAPHERRRFRTLFAKETRRFLRVPGQTLAQPIVTTALYFLVFGYALGGRVREIDGVSYSRFIVPGLMLLGLARTPF